MKVNCTPGGYDVQHRHIGDVNQRSQTNVPTSANNAKPSAEARKLATLSRACESPGFLRRSPCLARGDNLLQQRLMGLRRPTQRGILGTGMAIALWLASNGASAQHVPLPPTLVALDSPEGQRLFEEADARADYWSLSEQYVTQQSGNFCGVASGVMVLNALQVSAPIDKQTGSPFFTQDDFFNDCARRVLSPTLMPGMTIDQLVDLLQCHPARAQAFHAGETPLEEFRTLAARNLATPGDFIVVNYDRAGVGQEKMGHISPLGAYDAKTDKFLLLDVARYKYPPVWADATALFAAMHTDDFVAGKTRGFVVVTAAPSPPGPKGARPARNLMQLGIAILAVTFLLGAALGAVVQGQRYKRRLAQNTASLHRAG